MKIIHLTKLGYLASFAAAISCISACKQDTLFQDGKRAYINKADSISSYVGNNRLKIAFAVPDPAAVTAKIYWNDRSNSVTVPVVRKAGTDTVSTIIGPLAEGNYSFEIITYSASGVSSIPVKVAGKTYGAQYISLLPNRPVKDATYDAGTVSVSWGNATGDGLIRTEVQYTDVNNITRTVFVPVGSSTISLSNVNAGGPLITTIQHRTVFFPASSIDTFKSAYQKDTIITGTLKALAKAKGIQFGSLISSGNGTTTNGVINDGSPSSIYTTIATTEFTMGTSAWGPTRWAQTPPSDFNDVNGVTNWSRPKLDKITTMLITGPDNYMPAWFTGGTFTPAQMDVLLKNLITELMTSNDNKTKVDQWCVANELFNNDGTYRTMRWNDMGWEDDASGLTGTDKINLQHPAFIAKAFQYSRQLTNALLELRDYGIEHGEQTSRYYSKHKAYYQLVKHLLAKNIPIGVVGIQAHESIGDPVNGDFTNFKNTVAKFKKLGVAVYLQELDIAADKVNSLPQPWTDALAAQQRIDYYNIVKAAISGGATQINIWGVRDNNDPGWLPNQNPLPWDVNYKKKPAYYGIQRALYEAKLP